MASPTDLSSLMIILGSHGFIFLHIKMKYCIHSLDIVRRFKTKRPHSLSVRSDHGGEFENHGFETFCNEHGYDHNFSTPRITQ